MYVSWNEEKISVKLFGTVFFICVGCFAHFTEISF